MFRSNFLFYLCLKIYGIFKKIVHNLEDFSRCQLYSVIHVMNSKIVFIIKNVYNFNFFGIPNFKNYSNFLKNYSCFCEFIEDLKNVQNLKNILLLVIC